jgi:hypothetical protein
MCRDEVLDARGGMGKGEGVVSRASWTRQEETTRSE